MSSTAAAAGSKRKLESITNNSNDETSTETRISEMDTVIQSLLTCLDDMTEAPDPLLGMKACSTLLKLKSTQRDILDLLQQTNEDIESKQLQEEKMETSVDNLRYEQEHLQTKINQYRSFDLTNLIQMSKEELSKDEQDEATAENNNNKEHAIINQFLKADINEPNQHAKIIAKLHQEINWRGTLERDVNIKEKELQLLKSKLQLKSQFLKGLPDKLKEMERASSPIQKFFHTQKKLSVDTTTDASKKSTDADNNTGKQKSVVHLIGSDRHSRLEMARKLSGPLYTLFVQIQSYLDHRPNNSGGILLDVANYNNNTAAAAKTKDKNVFQPEEKVVLVHIPIPDVAGKTTAAAATNKSKTKYVTIQFMYLPKLPVVTALTMTTTGNNNNAVKDGGSIDHSTLLPYLFPQDDGNWTHFLDHVRATTNKEIEASSSSKDRNHPATSIGKPYMWCNYIAGLHIYTGQHPHEGLCSSTMVVIRELTRRVRANATLCHLLKSLSQLPNPIPIHPHMKDYFENSKTNSQSKDGTNEKPAASSNNTASCRLVKFKRRDKDDDDDDETENDKFTKCMFAVNLKRTDDGTGGDNANLVLRAKVCINLCRYPAIPPCWTLTSSDESWGEEHGTVTSLQSCTNPLHDEYLYQLQQQVNANSIQDFADKTVEETYDWILAHQLREIMNQWGSGKR